MAVRCPCGIRVDGEGEREMTANVREHLMIDHDVPPSRLMDIALMLDDLGDEVMAELLKLDVSMRSHLAPPTRTQEEIRKDTEESCMVGCVSEIPMSRAHMGQYDVSMFCSFCGAKLVADDDGELSKGWGEHLTMHAEKGHLSLDRVISREMRL